MASEPAQSFSSSTTPSAGSARTATISALREAAQRTGVDFTALFQTARVESGLNPDARARTSSATGLFQFIDSTWLATLAKHGAKHGISVASKAEALALRRDPAIASLMGAEHMADNAAALSAGIGRAVDGAELYLAHFLGVGGATRFLSAMAASPGMAASELLPAAARANRAIFTDRKTGNPRSLEQVFALLRSRFEGAGQAPSPTSLLRSLTRAAPAPASPSVGASAVTGADAETARRAAQAAYLLLAQLGAS